MKQAAGAGGNSTRSKQKGKEQSIRPGAKRKAQALKANQGFRMREPVAKKLVNKKLVKQPAASEAQSIVREVRKAKATNGGGGGKSPTHKFDDKARVAELKRTPSIALGAESEVVNRDGFNLAESLEVIHDSRQSNPGREKSLGRLPMEITLAYWQFWTQMVSNYQRTWGRLASKAMGMARP